MFYRMISSFRCSFSLFSNNFLNCLNEGSSFFFNSGSMPIVHRYFCYVSNMDDVTSIVDLRSLLILHKETMVRLIRRKPVSSSSMSFYNYCLFYYIKRRLIKNRNLFFIRNMKNRNKNFVPVFHRNFLKNKRYVHDIKDRSIHRNFLKNKRHVHDNKHIKVRPRNILAYVVYIKKKKYSFFRLKNTEAMKHFFWYRKYLGPTYRTYFCSLRNLLRSRLDAFFLFRYILLQFLNDYFVHLTLKNNGFRNQMKNKFSLYFSRRI